MQTEGGSPSVFLFGEQAEREDCLILFTRISEGPGCNVRRHYSLLGETIRGGLLFRIECIQIIA
jgi:hypothetical protein